MVTLMIPRVADEALRAISFDEPPGHRSLTIGFPTGPRAVEPLLAVLSRCSSLWREARRAAEGAVERTRSGVDDFGFVYLSDLDPCEEPFVGVSVDAFRDEILVSLPAFEEVMARFFRALISGAEKLGDSARSEAWWPELVRLTEKLEARVARAAQGLGGEYELKRRGIVNGEIEGCHDEAMFLDQLVTQGNGEIVGRTPHPADPAVTLIEYRLYQRDADGELKIPKALRQGPAKRKTVMSGLAAAPGLWQARAQEAADAAIRAGTMPPGGGRYKGSTADGLEIDGFIRDGVVTTFYVAW